MPERGSFKLGASAESLEKALAAAQGSYTIERWQQYGRPAFELTKGVINIHNLADSGKIVQELLSLHQGKTQVNLEVFPYGVVSSIGVRIHVVLEHESNG
jgi:hypothetical protein